MSFYVCARLHCKPAGAECADRNVDVYLLDVSLYENAGMAVQFDSRQFLFPSWHAASSVMSRLYRKPWQNVTLSMPVENFADNSVFESITTFLGVRCSTINLEIMDERGPYPAVLETVEKLHRAAWFDAGQQCPVRSSSGYPQTQQS